MREFPADAIEVFHGRVATAISRAPSAASLPPPGPPSYWERVAADIVSRLKAGDEGMRRPMLRALMHPLSVAGKLGHGDPLADTLLRTIFDATHDQPWIAAWSDQDAWIDAIELAHAYHRTANTEAYTDLAGSRANVVAGALQRLKERGFDHEIGPSRVSLTDTALTAACAVIEHAVQARGGVRVAHAIFASLIANGRLYRGLYLPGRTTSGTLKERPATIPWHFLYNLALKHLTGGGANDHAAWTETVELARDVASSLDVEVYGQFEGVNIHHSNVANEILDCTLYDELFAFQQWSHGEADQLFDWWLDALDAYACPIPVASLSEWRAFAHGLLACAAPNELMTVRPIDLASASLPKTVAAALLAATSHPVGTVNAGYQTPVQMDLRNAPFLPLIALWPDNYLVQPTGLAARALYEALFTLMRGAGDKHLERKLGDALEHLTVRVLGAHGKTPSVAGVKYNHPTLHETYEIDIALESKADVTLIECKRKALSRSGRGAGIANALNDISKGFLEPYIQMARHEVALRKQTSLTLGNGGTLTLGNRTVTRIALTMLDFGSLQDRLFIRNIVRVFFNASLDSADPATDAILAKVNAKAAQLRTLLNTLAVMTGNSLDEFLGLYEFGTWWLSVDQLSLVAVDGATIPEALAPLRHVTFRTRDLMSELAYVTLMSEQAGRT